MTDEFSLGLLGLAFIISIIYFMGAVRGPRR